MSPHSWGVETAAYILVLGSHIFSLSYLDKHDKNWAWTNYLSLRALQQADNVRAQLQRTMERFEVDLVSLADDAKLFVNIRQALVCGFFMQVAHKEGEKGNYLTVKDHQVIFEALVCYAPDNDLARRL